MTPLCDRGGALQDACDLYAGFSWRSSIPERRMEGQKKKQHALGCIDPDNAGEWQVRLLVGWADEEDGLGTWNPVSPVIWAVGRKLGPRDHQHTGDMWKEAKSERGARLLHVIVGAGD